MPPSSRRDELPAGAQGADLALGARLVAAGRVTPEQLADCLRAQRLEGGAERVRLSEILARRALVTAAEIEATLPNGPASVPFQEAPSEAAPPVRPPSGRPEPFPAEPSLPAPTAPSADRVPSLGDR